jgi:serine/threonine-protein kinase
MTDDAAAGSGTPHERSEDVPRSPADSRQRRLPGGMHIGPYEVVKHLASGGMADVYRVRHMSLQRHEAMKVPLAHLRHEDDFLRRFFQEARLAANLQHPNIVAIYAVSDTFGGRGGESEATAPSYFTMELVDGTDLDTFLEKRGQLAVDEAVPLLRGIADALDYAHARGVIHRDMKPSNVLLRVDETSPVGYVPKVSDFGIARAAVAADEEGTDAGMKTRPQRLTKAGAILGTPSYLSPEQAEGGSDLGPASDQYALGIMAYELLCGHTPFRYNPEAPMAVILSHLRDTPPPLSGIGPSPAVDAAINSVLGRALAKLSSNRFPNCRAFIDALDGAAHGTGTYAFGVPGTEMANVSQQMYGAASLIPAMRPGGATITGRITQQKSGSSGMVIGGLSAAALIVVGAVAVIIVRTHPSTTPGLVTPISSTASVTAPVGIPKPTPSVSAASQEVNRLTDKAEEDLKNVADEFKLLKQRQAEHELTAEQGREAIDLLKPEAFEALNDSHAALALDHSNHKAIIQHIDALIYVGQMAQARSEVKQALTAYPDDSTLLGLKKLTQNAK